MSSSLKTITWLAIESVFIALIWLPNIFCLSQFCPYLANEEVLQSQMISKVSNLFIDVAGIYACAKIAATTPMKTWDLSTEQDWFKHYLNIPASIDLHTNGQLSPPCFTPQSIVMFMPLINLPLNQAIMVFEAFSLIFMIAALSVLLKTYLKFNAYNVVHWWLVVLASVSVSFDFYFGQSDGLLSGLTAIFLLNWCSKQCLPAALAFTFTLAIKPQCALVMVAMSLAGRKYRLMLLTALLSGLLLLLTINIMGLNSVITYPRQILSFTQAQDTYKLPGLEGSLVSVLGPITLIAGRHAASRLSLPFALISLVIMYIIWRKAIKTTPLSFPFAYASSLLINFILAPRQHVYSLILLSTAWAITTPAVSLKQIVQLKQHTERLWCLVFFLFPALGWILCYINGVGTPGTRCLPLLLFMLLLALSRFRQIIKSTKQSSLPKII